MRVSIVATALDGHKTDSNTVLNMVSRIQNRNNGHSEGLFSQNTNNIENNTFNSIEGATALKLDEKFEIEKQEQGSTVNNLVQSAPETESEADNIPTGVSMENASYMESNEESSLMSKNVDSNFDLEPHNEEEHTPQLFSNENETQIENNLDDSNGNLNDSHGDEHTEKLFDQDSNEEEDFEIPAFLRKQKF